MEACAVYAVWKKVRQGTYEIRKEASFWMRMVIRCHTYPNKEFCGFKMISILKKIMVESLTVTHYTENSSIFKIKKGFTRSILFYLLDN